MQKPPLRYPIEVKSGSSVVKIYRTKRSDGRVIFQVKWYLGGRCSKQFADFQTAKEFAKQKADSLRSQTSTNILTTRQHTEYVEAKRLCGIESLVNVVKECLKAREMTGDQTILAAKEFANTIKPYTSAPTPEVLKAFIGAKQNAGIKIKTTYKNTFVLFAEAFGKFKFDSLKTSQLQYWLDQFNNPATRNTHRRRIVTLFRWSRKNGYLPKAAQTEAEDTERAKEPPYNIGIIDAETFKDCINKISDHPHYVSALALATFCGLRRSEVHGQDWKDIHLDRNLLRVTVAKSGTAQNRLVPICDRAAFYLQQHRVKSGPVCDNLAIDRIRDICITAGIELPNNCFRHSFISYRVAQTGDVAGTSLEAGNSPAIIHKHYRELVTKEQAAEWFSV